MRDEPEEALRSEVVDPGVRGFRRGDDVFFAFVVEVAVAHEKSPGIEKDSAGMSRGRVPARQGRVAHDRKKQSTTRRLELRRRRSFEERQPEYGPFLALGRTFVLAAEPSIQASG